MSKPPLRLLLIEDNESDVLLLRHYLRLAAPEHYEMDHASTLAAGKALLRQHDYAVILLDLQLPDSTGLETLAALTPLRLPMPILVLTGNREENLGLAAVAAGAEEFLIKDQLQGPELHRAIRYAVARRQADLARHQADARLRLVDDALPAMVTYVDRDERYRLVNQTWGLWNKLRPEDAIGRQVAEMYPPAIYAQLKPVFTRALAGEACQLELSHQFKDGVTRQVYCSYVPDFDAAGKVRGVVTLASDVSELRRAHKALQESEERYRMLAENATDMLTKHDLNGKFLYVSNYCRTLTGYAPEELVGRAAYELVHPDDLLAVQQNHQEVLAGRPSPVTLRLMRKDGRQIWVEGRSTVLKTPGTERVEGMLVVTRDISEQRRAESRLRLLATAVIQAGENIMITDAEGVIQYVNPAFERSLGYTSLEIIGQPTSILRDPKAAPKLFVELWETIRRGETWRGHLRNRRKDDRLIEIDLTISPVRDEHGVISQYVAIQRDVTQERQLAAQFRQAQKMEAVGRLASGVAHDFNNLLTVLMGHAQLLQMRLNADKTDPRQAALLASISEILKTSERAAGLVRQLLAFSRKESIQLKVLDPNAVVNDLAKLLRRLLEEGITLNLDLGLDTPHILGDAGQLEQVLVNLVVNARDAISGAGLVTISTRRGLVGPGARQAPGTLKPGNYLLLTVSDNGCGMDETTISHLFEPFFTTKPQGQGTGLGLSTVYGIVHQFGGHIEVVSTLGQGTSFSIYLPAVASELPAGESHQATAIMNTPTRSGTILVVEDDDMLRQIVETMLNELGFVVLSANGGKAALAIASDPALHLDLVLSDIVMPQMYGPALVKQLLVQRPALKVMFMTGYSEKAMFREEIQEKRYPILNKPFTAQALTLAIHQAFEDGSQA